MELLEIPGGVLLTGVEAFSLEDTLDCGQCFVFFRLPDGGFAGTAGGHAAVLHQDGDRVTLEGVTPGEYTAFWRRYLGLEEDYAAIRRSFIADEGLARCVRYAPGIRVLRQPAWEALVCFILSQNNNVKRIQGIVSRLCSGFGRQVGEAPDGRPLYAFPPAEALAGLDEAALAPLRSGWRAGYVLDAARKVAEGRINLDRIAALPLEEAREALRTIHGVGPKVADCVLLYGMGRYAAFPLDVWMKRAMAELFPGRTPADFGPYAGIAQQYIFHYCRSHPLELRKSG